MGEFLHPDVFVEEVAGEPTIPSASTSTAAFVGTSLKGPIDKVGLATSFQDFVRQYGKNAGGYLEDSLYGFFANGGKRAFIAGVKGAGNAAATINAPSIGGAPTPGSVTSVNAAPWVLAPAQTLVVHFDTGGDQTKTFNATRAVKAGGAFGGTPVASDEILLKFDGGQTQTVIFAGTETTAALVAEAINEQVTGGRAVVNAGRVDLQSDTQGTGSHVQVVSGTGTALTQTGISAGTVNGTGNVVNIAAVTMAEALAVLASLMNGAASNDGSGHLVVTSAVSGGASTAQVKNTSTATGFGFSNTAGTGTAAGAPVDMFSVTAKSPGAWGNVLTHSTTRWSVATAEDLVTGATQVKLLDITKAQIGDVVKIDDGTTSVIVHVRQLDLVNKRIKFQAISIGLTIATGAVAKTASSHRAQTTLALAALTSDTIITVTSPSQFRIGSEITLDDGVAAVLVRVVTKVNGAQITLNAATGVALAAGTPVALQSFDLTVKENGIVEKVFAFVSTQPTDEVDYFGVRFVGNSNESVNVTLIDLSPVIATALYKRPAPTADVFLVGGDDGATPGDNDYIGSDSAPKSGMHLFDDVTSISILAIPGVTTVGVQGAVADYAELRKNLIVISDVPLADDQPLDALDWRNNILNRDTSYTALYYPWLIIRDRNAPSSVKNPQKNCPQSGFIAGLYARVDNDENVSVAPANFELLEVQGLTHYTSDGEHDLLNNQGVNVTRTFPGEGIKVMGERTLAKTEDGRHYINIRRLLLFIETSLKAGLRAFVMKPINTGTFRRVTSSASRFMRSIWKQGMLFPSNDFKAAQFVKCDTENNPAETRTLGQLYLDIGVNPPYPAEFVIARVGLFDGVSSVSETVLNR